MNNILKKNILDKKENKLEENEENNKNEEDIKNTKKIGIKDFLIDKTDIFKNENNESISKSYDLFSTNSNIELSYSLSETKEYKQGYNCFEFLENDEIIIPIYENKNYINIEKKVYSKFKNNEKFPLVFENNNIFLLDEKFLINKIINSYINKDKLSNIIKDDKIINNEENNPLIDIIMLSKINYNKKDEYNLILSKLNYKNDFYIKLLIKISNWEILFNNLKKEKEIINHILLNFENMDIENKNEYTNEFYNNYTKFELSLEFILLNLFIFKDYFTIFQLKDIYSFIFSETKFKYELINNNKINYFDIFIRFINENKNALYSILYSFILVNFDYLYKNSNKSNIIKNLDCLKNNDKNIFNNKYYLFFLNNHKKYKIIS